MSSLLIVAVPRSCSSNDSLFLSSSDEWRLYLFQLLLFIIIYYFHSQDLIKDLHSELSGDFRKMVMATLKTPAEFDAYELNSAIKVNTRS